MKHKLYYIHIIYIRMNIWNLLDAKIEGKNLGDRSGTSVSLNTTGDIVAIGAPFNGNANSGYVQVYQYTVEAGWEQLGLDIDGENNGDNFGKSVSLNSSGRKVAIGSPFNKFSTGNIKVYEYDGNNWIKLGDDIEGAFFGDQFGFSVSLNGDGNIVAVGSPFGGNNDGGYIGIYNYINNNWQQLGLDIDGENEDDRFGHSISLNNEGNRVAISSLFVGNNNNAGYIRVYEFNGNWKQIDNDNINREDDDEFGFSISLNSEGNRLAVGSPSGGENNGGYVRIFNYINDNWEQFGDEIPGEIEGDESGCSVSLNSEGDMVAIGERNNDQNKGRVRVFRYNEEDLIWEQLEPSINGEENGDRNGWSVSLNSEGNRVAIGIPFDDVSGENSGSVRVFELEEPVLEEPVLEEPLEEPVLEELVLEEPVLEEPLEEPVDDVFVFYLIKFFYIENDIKIYETLSKGIKNYTENKQKSILTKIIQNE